LQIICERKYRNWDTEHTEAVPYALRIDDMGLNAVARTCGVPKAELKSRIEGENKNVWLTVWSPERAGRRFEVTYFVVRIFCSGLSLMIYDAFHVNIYT
jgi:hypothetical protein